MKITIELPTGLHRKILKAALNEHKSITQIVNEIVQLGSKQKLQRKHVNKYRKRK